MKYLKKISLFALLFVFALLVTGCGAKNVEGTLEEIMTKVYENVPDDHIPMMLENTEVTEDNIEYYLGTKDIEYEEALASESGIGSVAHSVVLVRVKDNADIEEIKNKIKTNVNPRKWICVGVEDDEVIVENEGNLIILIMVQEESTRKTIEESFDKLLD